MKLQLATLTNDDLEKLSEEEIRKIIDYEYNVEQNLNDIYYDAEELLNNPKHHNTILRILELFLVADGTSYGDPQDYHRSKSPYLIFKHLKEEISISEEEFFNLIKALYSQKLLTYFNAHDFSDNPLLPFENYIPEDDLTKNIDKTLRWRYNLNWLYQNHKNLFSIPVPAIEENSFSIPEYTYAACLNYGSIFELAIESFLKLTDKGMHFLQTLTNKTIKDSLKVANTLNNKLKDEIEKQEKSIIEQKETIDKQKESIKEHQSLTTELNEKLEKQKNEINAFYQHIVSILSLLVAAFCFIGINISALPKIEDNFAENVIIINLSLILVTTVIFWIIKTLIFESASTQKNNKFWLLIIGSASILLIVIYGWLGPNVEKNNLTKYKKEIEKKYDVKLEKLTHELEKADLKVENLNKKIERLEEQKNSPQQ
ncbi:peptidoglycan hydrolase CwlO-like protein [Bacillus mycoides]